MAESLMRVEEAQARVLALAGQRPPAGRGQVRPEHQPEGPAAATDVVAVEAALGRVLAEDVAAAVTLPPWDNSAMDGYAIRAEDVRDATDRAPVRLRVVGDAPAGGAPSGVVVQPGEAVRIATGAPVPPGADAIAQVELTESDEAMRGDALPSVVGVRAAIAPRTHIRGVGSDLHAGDLLLAAGTAVGPAQVALLAGAGIAEVRVHRRPRIGVLATGNEVRAAGEALDATGIPDANGPGLRALVAAAGAEPIDLGIARDDLDDVLRRLRLGIEAGADAIVVAGGVSVGPYDVVKAAFEALGSVELWRVAVQPGKPFALATVARRSSADAAGRPILLFGLPGNPVSGFVTFELFVRPAIRVLAGRAAPLRAPDRGVLLDEARTSTGRRAYLRVTAERDPEGGVIRDGQGRARVRLARGTAGQGSHVLSALATAEALAIVPEDVEVHPAGGPVDLLWLDAP